VTDHAAGKLDRIQRTPFRPASARLIMPPFDCMIRRLACGSADQGAKIMTEDPARRGVNCRGAGALVLAVFWQNFARWRYRKAGCPQVLGNSPLVFRVKE
jgi:hypothetical protein